jgi:Mn2+/Fe2+ NRAMP family transporter
MWFWQASQEVEERLAAGQHRLWQRRGASRTELKYAAYDIDVGMIVSNTVMYFIIAATAATLYRTGHTHIGSAAEAAQALRPIAGPYATWLFGIGVAAAGLIAIPVLTTSGAYAVAALWRRPAGLGERPHRAPLFYGVIALSTALGIVMNAIGINPIDALVVAAVINGFLTPPILVLLMLAANNRAILGKQVNGPLLNVIGWATAAIMTAAVIGLLVTLRP